MVPKSQRLDQLFRTRAKDPDSSLADMLLDSWAEVEDAVLADEGAAREALTAAAEAMPELASPVAERRALATAVLTSRGEVVFADPAFRALIGDPADLRPMLRRALREGPVVGLVEGSAGAAFIAWVGLAATAARWALDPAAAEALSAGRDRLAVVVSAPSRSSELARRAARVLDLTALEARLAEALLFAPNLDVAAAEVGVGRETARDALRRINAKAGVRRTPELISRLIEIMCAARGRPSGVEEVAQAAFGLTPAEARVAALIARGATAPEAAEALGLGAETVKTHLKTIFQKTGAKRAKDLSRLLAEARELVALADASEPVFGQEVNGRLRIVSSLDGARRIALIDYGPPGGEPVLVFHGAAAGRRLPGPFRDLLRERGLRPIVVQRPGFGLTDPAVGDYAAAGAADLAAVIERLRLRKVAVFARDTGAPVALEFARRHPELISRGVLLNPHPPLSLGDERLTFAAQVQKHLLRNPELVGPFAEFLRRQATTPLMRRIVRKTVSEVASDRRAIEDPLVMDFLVRDIQALCARSIRGFAAEHGVYAGGWEPPQGIVAGPWTLALSRDLPGHPDPTWLALPDMRRVWIEGAGVLPQFICPEVLVELLAPRET